MDLVRHSLRLRLIGGLLLLMARSSVADDLDGRFLIQLRSRQLFDLAATFCRQKLDGDSIEPSEQARWTVELIATDAQRALNLPPGRRTNAWRAARDVAAEFARRNPAHSHLALVSLEDALVVLARAELARHEADLGAGGAASRERARADLRVAITMLKKVEEDVRVLLRSVRPSSRTKGGLRKQELLSMLANAQHQLARAYRNQALTYPEKSADWVASLTRSLAQLDQISATDQIRWQVRLDRIACLRSLGRRADAERALDSLGAAEPPSIVAQQAAAQRIRLLLTYNRATEAWQRFGRAEQSGQPATAQLELARVATLAALWQEATKNQQQPRARSWQSKALAAIERMQQQHGPYWTRRAESLLMGTVGSGRADLDLLVRAAQNHFRRGKSDDAVVAFTRAASAAIEAGLEDRALDMYATAAFIRYQQHDLADALSRYRQAAVRFPQAVKASEVHKTAVMVGVKLVRGGDDDALVTYRQLLDEHLKLWPGGPIADQMRLRLGMLLAGERKWGPAITEFQAIVGDDRKSLETSLDHLYRCYEASFEERLLAGSDYEPDLANAIAHMQRIVLGGQGRLPDTWTPLLRQAAILTVRLRLRLASQELGSARSMLTAAIAGSSDAPPQWRSEANGLLTLVLARENQFAAAGDAVKQVADAELWELLEGLGAIASASPTLAQRLAHIQLVVVDRLEQHRSELDSGQRMLLSRTRGNVFVALGELEQARKVFEQLAAKHPRDGAIQRAYADVLLQGTDKRWTAAALAQWRRVLAGSRPQSQGWFQAKFGVAMAHYKLGDSQEAARMIQLVATLHPELGGPELRGSFEQLLARCKQ